MICSGAADMKASGTQSVEAPMTMEDVMTSVKRTMPQGCIGCFSTVHVVVRFVSDLSGSPCIPRCCSPVGPSPRGSTLTSSLMLTPVTS